MLKARKRQARMIPMEATIVVTANSHADTTTGTTFSLILSDGGLSPVGRKNMDDVSTIYVRHLFPSNIVHTPSVPTGCPMD